MDSIVSAAVEEICAEGSGGVPLPKLWTMLRPSLSGSGLDLCDGVKGVIWTRLLRVPGVRLNVEGRVVRASDGSIREVGDAEGLGVVLVAEEHVRDSFLGLSDRVATGRDVPQMQRRVLERVALARTKGVTQNQLAKDFKLKGNDIFYHLRGLEYNRLIVRQSTIVKSGGRNDKAPSVVNTNLVYLYRYAKHIDSNSQLRVEITKENLSEGPAETDDKSLAGNDFTGEQVAGEDVCVKNFLPALEAVCQKLEEANNKVLVVTDIKRALGYRKTKGHRAWRNVVNRLKEANLVEEISAKVNSTDKKRKRSDEKSISCLRLLKKFDPKDFQTKTLPSGYDISNSTRAKNHKGKHPNERVVELPIENQIYDMVDVEGVKGITIFEVCSRLGLNYKKYYSRVVDMCSRFGMHIQAENHNRTKIYRIWTIGNAKKSSAIQGTVCTEVSQSAGRLMSIEQPSSQDLLRNSSSWELNSEKTGGMVDASGLPTTSLSKEEKGCNEKSDEARGMIELDANGVVSQSPVSTLSTPNPRASKRHPCLDLSVITTRRKERILSRLKNEKFILMAELHKWLQSLEVEKPTKMDKKTLLRVLQSLQRDGQCKCVQVKFPSLFNQSNDHPKCVILHPSVGSVSELVGQIYKRAREFDAECRGHLPAQLKTNNVHVTKLMEVDRSCEDNSTRRYPHAEAMRSNGFISSKLVRTKLLHYFLWSYLSSSSDWEDAFSHGRYGSDPNNPSSTLKLFELDAALRAMPLELFLQVVGSAGGNFNLSEYCEHGLKLEDLAVQEYKCLMDNSTTTRVSSIIDIMLRLKLVQVVTEETAKGIGVIPHDFLTYAMELKPYIEVPRGPSMNSHDHCPRVRKDFVFCSKDSVDAYWQTLEYCYAAADPTTASHAFPGSTVPEVFSSRSWSIVRIMSAEQRMELLERVARNDPHKKVSFEDCVNTARELDLTLEQVLRASCDKRRHLYRCSFDFKTKKCEYQSADKTLLKKRKRSCDVTREDSSKTSIDAESYDGNLQHETDCLLSEKSESCPSDTVESETNKDGKDACSLIHQFAFARVKPLRRRKFVWDDASDRQLLIKYSRYRVTRGVNFFRVEWASISDLPAHPDTCKKRMAVLNRIITVRNTVLMLCNVLGNRYLRYISETSKSGLHKSSNPSEVPEGSYLGKCPVEHTSVSTSDLNSREENWDNFEDPGVKLALDEVLRCIRVDKSRRSYKNELKRKDPEKPPVTADDSNPQGCIFSEKQDKVLSLSNNGEQNCSFTEKDHEGCAVDFESCKKTQNCTYSYNANGRMNHSLSSKETAITRLLTESLSIANAVELLKLAFLSSSSSSEVQTFIADTLRQYSESDLYAAFNYLRQKNFMIAGSGCRPYVLSKQFLHTACFSPFPVDSGKRATKFSTWLSENEDLQINGDNLSLDLQCGEAFHLLALVSSGKLIMSMSLPDEGIGEAENSNALTQSGKNTTDNVKKQDFLSECCQRRAKGFPGISVILDHVTYFESESANSLTHSEKGNCSASDVNEKDFFLVQEENKDIDAHPTSSKDTSFPSQLDSEPIWQDMATYAEFMLPESEARPCVSPNVLQSLYMTINKAGEQGLNTQEISQTAIVQGNPPIDIFLDTLEAFQLVVKVNAYDSVRVVDASYKSKYFVTMFSDSGKNCTPSFWTRSLRNYKSSVIHPSEEKPTGEQNIQIEPEVQLPNSCEMMIPDEYKQKTPSQGDEHVGLFPTDGNQCVFRPILPWINGDGSTDTIMYRGLVRQILGVVMQNPGILEDDLLSRMDVLNPQSCKRLLELMILDKHITVRKIFQTTSCTQPGLLQGFIKPKMETSDFLFRRHLFANPMSTQYL